VGDHYDGGPVLAAVGGQERDDRFGGGRVEGQQRLELEITG